MWGLINAFSQPITVNKLQDTESQAPATSAQERSCCVVCGAVGKQSKIPAMFISLE